eukprot:GHVS01081717.1.p1 GENE.GHVS01081717.1~~GHVS01081717.1.p1  ORF type:complete len:781 (+),score=87.00 GHVS01081717.1:273-2615(+)
MALATLAVSFLTLLCLVVRTSALAHVFVAVGAKDFCLSPMLSMKPFEIQVNPLNPDPVLNSNMHAVLPFLQHAPTTSRSVNFKDDDKFFAAGGHPGSTEIGTADGKRHTLDLKSGHIYLARCDKEGCHVDDYHDEAFLASLKAATHHQDVGPLASVLIGWLDSDEPDRDEWETCKMETKKLVYDAEKGIIGKAVELARTTLDSEWDKHGSSVATKCVLLMDHLALRSKKAGTYFQLNGAMWNYVLSEEERISGPMDDAILEAELAEQSKLKEGTVTAAIAEKARLKTTELLSLQTNFHKAKAMAILTNGNSSTYTHKYEADNFELRGCGLMWYELIEEEKGGADVFVARKYLLQEAHNIASKERANSDETAFYFDAMVNNSWADALETKVNDMADYIVANRLQHVDDIPEAALRTIDLKFVDAMIELLQKLRVQTSKWIATALRNAQVYRHIFELNANTGSVDHGKVTTDPTEMLAIVRQAGSLYGIEKIDALREQLVLLDGILEKRHLIYSDARDALAANNRATSAAIDDVLTGKHSPLDGVNLEKLVDTSLTIHHPQLVFFVRPSTPLFDKWFRLYSEALVDVIKGEMTLSKADWELVTLAERLKARDPVKTNIPEYKMNSDLENVKMPAFVVDHWIKSLRGKLQAPKAVLPSMQRFPWFDSSMFVPSKAEPEEDITVEQGTKEKQGNKITVQKGLAMPAKTGRLRRRVITFWWRMRKEIRQIWAVEPLRVEVDDLAEENKSLVNSMQAVIAPREIVMWCRTRRTRHSRWRCLRRSGF